ncbi:hypothetical protein J6590_000485 [Homalodisca vitripennis]|nr:hypothetical protein J6590_000485 [Homalodisca vitripennis]
MFLVKTHHGHKFVYNVHKDSRKSGRYLSHVVTEALTTLVTYWGRKPLQQMRILTL